MAGMSQQELLEVLGDNKAAAACGHAVYPVEDAAGSTEQKPGDRDSWKDLYRVLVTSLRHSSAQFQSLSIEALTLGLWSLSSAHASLRDDIHGRQLGLQDREVIKSFIYFGEWARAFQAGKSVQELAAALYIQESAVLCYQPVSRPMLPAFLLAVDHSHRQLLLVVRGTTQLADALTDLVAHTSALGPGQAHSGMLDCAKAIIQQCLPAMEQQLQQNPGYRLHCIGHSLGGGVAVLAAYLLRNTPELCSRLAAASGVMATGFGTPPVMTQELADSVSSYTRCLVHNHDLVPRTCVASLAVLRQELEAQKEAVFSNNTTMAWLRDSGVLEGGKSLVAGMVSYAATNTTATRVAAAVTRSAGMQRFMAAGLQVGASLLVNKMKQLHTEAMEETGSGAAAASTIMYSSSSSTAQHSGLQSSSAADSKLSSLANRGSKAECIAASEPTAAAAAATPAATGWSGLAALRQAAAAAADGLASKQEQQEQQEQPAATQSAAGGSRTAAGQQLAEEQAAASVMHHHMLYCPGQLYYLKRSGVDEDARYELICQADNSSTAAAAVAECDSTSYPASRINRFGKILVNSSMLRDHYMGHYITGLHKLEVQLLNDM